MQVLHSLQDFPLRNHNRVQQKSAAWHQTSSGMHSMSSKTITELALQSDGGKKLGEKRQQRQRINASALRALPLAVFKHLLPNEKMDA